MLDTAIQPLPVRDAVNQALPVLDAAIQALPVRDAVNQARWAEGGSLSWRAVASTDMRASFSSAAELRRSSALPDSWLISSSPSSPSSAQPSAVAAAPFCHAYYNTTGCDVWHGVALLL